MSASTRLFPLLLLLALLPVEAAEAQRIRIAAANLTSGNAQSYDAGHGIRILQGLRPDIMLVQEFNYGSGSAANIREMVDTVCGPGFFYFRETNTGSIPNGIISRFPILEAGQWVSPVAERDFSWARLDLPGNRELLAVSVHLPTTDSQRPNEANQLTAYINNYYAQNNGARATDYLVIGGDFNSDTRTESALTILGSVVTIGTTHPADRSGNLNTNAGRNKPYDAVYAGKGLHSLQTPTVLGATTFLNGVVVDTRVYSPISEITPAMVNDSAATNMQHMAVVKDFQIPLAADPPVLELVSFSLSVTGSPRLDLEFRATAGATYEAQATSVLKSGVWANLGRFTVAGTIGAIAVVPGPPEDGAVSDPLLGTGPRRFYRVIRR